MFIYPKELFLRLKESWRSIRLTSTERIPRLPHDKIVKRLLEVAYHTSFMSEEARRIVFHVIYWPQERMLQEVARYTKPYGRTYPIVFDRSRPFSESELLRLAPATDPTKVLIGVELAGDLSDPEEGLRIWGLVDTGSSWWDFIHGESTSGNPPPNHLTISSAEPGNLVISRAGNIILKLQRGEIIRPTGGILKRGPIGDFFEKPVAELVEEVCNVLQCRRYSEREYFDLPQRLYLQYFERIIFHVRRKMHGGTVIVVPHTFSEKEAFMDRLLIKYPCIDDRSWNLLTDTLVLKRKYLDLHVSLLKRQCDICPEMYQEVTKVYEEVEEISEALSDSIKFVAALTGVDGAVVITDRLKLLGFGAEVIVASPGLDHVKVSHDVYGTSGKMISIESFGTRHRSAFRFCASIENTVAFVISQDGGVKAIKKKGDDVVLWSDINLGLFGI